MILPFVSLCSILLLTTGFKPLGDVLDKAAKEVQKVAPADSEAGKAARVAGAMASVMDSEMGPVREFQLGRELLARLVGGHDVISMDHPAAIYLNQVGRTTSLATNSPYPYRPYTFVLVRDDTVNAFAVPGGFVVVTTGMLEFLHDEEELAAICGHEVSHIELRHGIKAVGQEKVIRLFNVMKDVSLQGSDLATSDKPEVKLARDLMDEVTNGILDSIRGGYSVEVETEADQRAMDLCHALGYDASALTRVLERFRETKGTYGGANYPQERGADAVTYLASLAPAGTHSPSAIRTARFQIAVNKLGE